MLSVLFYNFLVLFLGFWRWRCLSRVPHCPVPLGHGQGNQWRFRRGRVLVKCFSSAIGWQRQSEVWRAGQTRTRKGQGETFSNINTVKWLPKHHNFVILKCIQILWNVIFTPYSWLDLVQNWGRRLYSFLLAVYSIFTLFYIFVAYFPLKRYIYKHRCGEEIHMAYFHLYDDNGDRCWLAVFTHPPYHNYVLILQFLFVFPKYSCFPKIFLLEKDFLQLFWTALFLFIFLSLLYSLQTALWTKQNLMFTTF